MAIPPPPMPPGPPPPPIGGLKLGNVAGGDGRSALLQSIQKGTKLKKTATVDKSGPALSGKVCDSSSSSPKRTNNNYNSNNANSNSTVVGNGAPKLGGLFEGLSAMPKLKPVNGSRASPSQRPSDVNATMSARDGSPPTVAVASNNNSTDFNAELTKHLTLKRQKQQINATEANLKTNRGPPPQPPTSTKNLVTSTSDSVLEKPKIISSMRSSPLMKDNTKASSPTLSEGSEGAAGSIKAGHVKDKASNLKSPPISVSGSSPFPTQHFATMRTPLNLCQSQDAININIRTAPNPPIGRPTVAPPKPPTMKPPPPPTPARSISNSNLNNMQNMSSPTSPPSTAPTNAIQNSAFSTPSTQSPSSASSFNNVSALREQYRTGSITTSSPSPPTAVTTSTTTLKSTGSPVHKSNISREKAPLPIILNGGSIIAPPLPPHRTCPAPPPPQRQSSNAGSVAPPVPPQRHSSIRANAPLTPPNSNTSINFGSGLANANSVSRLVTDLESKFGKRFHNVTEFPKPPPFLNIQKIYPSRTIKTTNGM